MKLQVYLRAGGEGARVGGGGVELCVGARARPRARLSLWIEPVSREKIERISRLRRHLSSAPLSRRF